MPKLREKPCPRDGWKYPGFHICLDLSDPINRRVEDGRNRDSEGRIIKVGQTVVHKAAISVGKREAAANDPRRIERNQTIVDLYNDEEFSMREIAERLGLDHRTVMNVLHRARDNGDVIIRRAARRTGRY